MIRTEPVQAYLDGLRPERDPLLAEMEALAARDSVPIVEWETGRLLATLARALRPARVLEVGTAIGYSTLHMARELDPESRIVTLERDPERIAAARGFWGRDGVQDRFDVVFLDASKTEVAEYLALLEGKLARRCVLLVDNLLMSGEAALPDGAASHWTAE